MLFAGSASFPALFSSGEAIVLDGSPQEWPRMIPFIIESDSQITNSRRSSPEDLSARVWFFFDSAAFYFFADIKDSDPMVNPYGDYNLHGGDSFQAYPGFREDNNYGTFGARDFQLIFGFKGEEIRAMVFQQKEGSLIPAPPVAAKKNSRGYSVEGAIPLSLFGIPKVEPGDTVWIDFSLTSQAGEENHLMMSAGGDGKSLALPQKWQRSILVKDITSLRDFYLLTPPRIFPGQYTRFYTYYKGEPLEGEFILDGTPYVTDEDGGAEVRFSRPGVVEFSCTAYGSVYTEEITVMEIKNPNPKEEKLLSLLLLPVMVLAGVLHYRRRK